MHISSAVVACALVLGAAPFAGGHRSAKALPETFTAFAVDMNRAASTTTVDMRIERWSSDAERDRLLEVLRQQKDPDRATRDLLRGLQELPRVGSIRTPNSVAWDLRYAREQPLEDGARQIVLATADRCLGSEQPGAHA